MPWKRIPIEVRFWPRVIKSDDPDKCWGWKGFKCPFGYGRVSRGGRNGGWFILAHRLSWILANGELADDICVLHKCDNPACTNPKHLFLGTRQDNNRDMVSKGRNQKGECSGRSKLTAAAVTEIVRRARSGELQRLIAKDFGIGRSYIPNLVSGRTWKHLNLVTPLPALQQNGDAESSDVNRHAAS